MPGVNRVRIWVIGRKGREQEDGSKYRNNKIKAENGMGKRVETELQITKSAV